MTDQAAKKEVAKKRAAVLKATTDRTCRNAWRAPRNLLKEQKRVQKLICQSIRETGQNCARDRRGAGDAHPQGALVPDRV